MRVNVHDFSGHPFQVQMSRELAGRGHEVVHNYSTQFVTGRGRLTVEAADPPTLRIEGITCRVPMVRYKPLGRARFELSYAGAWRRRLVRERFDVVVACNVPLLALARMRRYFERTRQPWVLWHQDLYSLGVSAEAARRLPVPVAQAARAWAERLERRQVGHADRVVAITDAMIEQYRCWGVERGGLHVVPNWAPLGDITPGQRDNAWSNSHGLPASSFRLVYAGTLGRKHNPLLLLEILDAVRAKGIDAILVVASEGDGADLLATAAAGRDDVRLVGYQPADSFSDVLASGDAVIALLEPDAARFSVPSKVLSYLSAGRPIVALVPAANPAAKDVEMCGGYVGSPTHGGAREAAEWLGALAADPAALRRIGQRSRQLAERRFDIDRITDTLEGVFADVANGVAEPAPQVPARRIA